MSNFQNDSIFWIEVEKIKPNPFQPRREFSEDKLNYLAESIRQYGVLQPLVVTRKEIEKPDGGLVSEYELIAGERRLRASRIAGLSQVPAIIRTETEDEGMKLELAIIENLQREDLNPIDRARAFERLVVDFGLKHIEIAKKMGKSREYISNSLRLLALPEDIKEAISASLITEGHARPLMMLRDRPEEQATLFKEILYKKLTVRDAEAIAKKIAFDKVRRKVLPPDPEMIELEKEIAESLGTRVQIERKEVGGKLTIDFFSNEDLKKILDLVHSNERKSPTEMLDNYIESNNIVEDVNSKEKRESFSEDIKKEVEEKEEATEEVAEETKEETPTEEKKEEVKEEETPKEEKKEEIEEIKENFYQEETVSDFSENLDQNLDNQEKNIETSEVRENNFVSENQNLEETDNLKNSGKTAIVEGIDQEDFAKKMENIQNTVILNPQSEISSEKGDNKEVIEENINEIREEKPIEEKKVETNEKSKEDDDDLYSIKDFSI